MSGFTVCNGQPLRRTWLATVLKYSRNDQSGLLTSTNPEIDWLGWFSWISIAVCHSLRVTHPYSSTGAINLCLTLASSSFCLTMQSMHPAWPLPVRTNATATAVFLRPKHWASSARRLKSSSRLHSLHKKDITRKNFRTRPAPSRTCCRLAAVLVLLRPWWRRRRKPLSPNSNGCRKTVQKWMREWLFYDILCILL